MHIQEYTIERQHCKYKVTQITVIIWVHLYILFFHATEWKIKGIATVAYILNPYYQVIKFIFNNSICENIQSSLLIPVKN